MHLLHFLRDYALESIQNTYYHLKVSKVFNKAKGQVQINFEKNNFQEYDMYQFKFWKSIGRGNDKIQATMQQNVVLLSTCVVATCLEIEKGRV